MSKFEFTAEDRLNTGKGAVRRLRHAGQVPAVVYGGDKDPQSITLAHDEILHALDSEAVFSHILKLTINGKAEQVVIKDLQRHPYKPKISHVDFLRVSAKEEITMHVPLHFMGEEEAPGVKAGGAFTKSITDIEIRCLPSKLPEYVELDVSQMALDTALHLSDLKLPSGVVLTHGVDEEHDQPIISLHVRKVSQEDAAAEEQEAEAAEAASEQTETEVEAKANEALEEDHGEAKEE